MLYHLSYRPRLWYIPLISRPAITRGPAVQVPSYQHRRSGRGRSAARNHYTFETRRRASIVSMSSMERTLIIGGTGTIGRAVVEQMSATGAAVRAMVRNPEAAGIPAQVEVVRGDLTVPETLDASLDGIAAVFLVWTAPAAAAEPALERIAKYAGASFTLRLRLRRHIRCFNLRCRIGARSCTRESKV